MFEYNIILLFIWMVVGLMDYIFGVMFNVVGLVVYE